VERPLALRITESEYESDLKEPLEPLFRRLLALCADPGAEPPNVRHALSSALWMHSGSSTDILKALEGLYPDLKKALKAPRALAPFVDRLEGKSGVVPRDRTYEVAMEAYVRRIAPELDRVPLLALALPVQAKPRGRSSGKCLLPAGVLAVLLLDAPVPERILRVPGMAEALARAVMEPADPDGPGLFRLSAKRREALKAVLLRPDIRRKPAAREFLPGGQYNIAGTVLSYSTEPLIRAVLGPSPVALLAREGLSLDGPDGQPDLEAWIEPDEEGGPSPAELLARSTRSSRPSTFPDRPEVLESTGSDGLPLAIWAAAHRHVPSERIEPYLDFFTSGRAPVEAAERIIRSSWKAPSRPFLLLRGPDGRPLACQAILQIPDFTLAPDDLELLLAGKGEVLKTFFHQDLSRRTSVSRDPWRDAFLDAVAALPDADRAEAWERVLDLFPPTVVQWNPGFEQDWILGIARHPGAAEILDQPGRACGLLRHLSVWAGRNTPPNKRAEEDLAAILECLASRLTRTEASRLGRLASFQRLVGNAHFERWKGGAPSEAETRAFLAAAAARRNAARSLALDPSAADEPEPFL
jgi:hypothetical protein